MKFRITGVADNAFEVSLRTYNAVPWRLTLIDSQGNVTGCMDMQTRDIRNLRNILDGLLMAEDQRRDIGL